MWTPVPPGVVVGLSDRPLLCMSVNPSTGEAAIGGSDHGVYTIDAYSGRMTRNLHTARYGHGEWVTCVAHVGPHGGIVSGGMDSKLCLWDRLVARR